MNSGITWPVSSGRISSPFGSRVSPTAGASSNHKGVDIAVPVGTSVMAAMSGIVSGTMYSKERGSYVVVDHGNGVQSIYQHLQQFAVNKGQRVGAGEKIALSGNSGRSTGPHLHFEILKDGKAVNPQTFKSTDVVGGISDITENLSGGNIIQLIENNWYWIIGALILVGIVSKVRR